MSNPYNWLLSKCCLAIWNTAEALHVNLGKAAPYIFGGMIGSWPRKVKETEQ